MSVGNWGASGARRSGGAADDQLDESHAPRDSAEQSPAASDAAVSESSVSGSSVSGSAVSESSASESSVSKSSVSKSSVSKSSVSESSVSREDVDDSTGDRLFGSFDMDRLERAVHALTDSRQQLANENAELRSELEASQLRVRDLDASVIELTRRRADALDHLDDLIARLDRLEAEATSR